MFGFLFIVWLVLNLVWLLYASIEEDNWFGELMYKKDSKGLSLADILLLSVFCIANVILCIIWQFKRTDKTRFKDFFNKPRLFKKN